MNEDNLARFYQTSGYTVIRSASGAWYSASPQIYQSLPPTDTRDPSVEELSELFRKHKLLGVQFPNSRASGIPAGRFMMRDQNYGMGSLQRQFRQHVKRGLQRCEVREIDFNHLEGIGRPVNLDAMSRRSHRISHLVDASRWRRFCEAGQATPGAGVMASFADGRLAAYLVYFVAGSTAYGLHMFSHADLRELRPNHLLYYSFTRSMIERDDIRAVSVGLQSIPRLREIDDFKRHAGFQREPCYLSVVLNPLARLALQNRLSELTLGTLDRLVGGNGRLRRMRLVTQMANKTDCRP